MTRKHYAMLARAIGAAWEESGTFDALVLALEMELERDNPRFDAQRFREAIAEARAVSREYLYREGREAV